MRCVIIPVEEEEEEDSGRGEGRQEKRGEAEEECVDVEACFATRAWQELLAKVSRAGAGVCCRC